MSQYLFFVSNDISGKTMLAHPAKDFAGFVRSQTTNLPVLPITFDVYHALPKAGQSEFKVRLPSFTPCTFPKSPWRKGRTKQNAGPCNLVILDVDDSGDAARLEQPGALSELLEGLNWFAYRTVSHTPEKPRMRLMVEARQIQPARYADAVRTVATRLRLKTLTPESLIPCQPMFVPCLLEGQDMDWDDPTIATSFDGRAFKESAIAEGHTFGSDESPAALQSGDAEDTGGLEFLKSPDPTATLEVVESALGYISPDILYPEWRVIGCAIAHQFQNDPDAGFSLFDKWSSKGTSYDEAAALTLWEGIDPSPKDRVPATIASLFMAAKKAGWSDPRRPSNSQESTTDQDSLLGKLDNHRLHLTQPPPKPVSVYSLAGQQISTAGNITVFSAQAKSGKTAVMGALPASALGAEDGAEGCGDFLGFTGAPHDGKAVIYFDTEQAPYDAWTLIHRAALRAEVKTWPENFRFYSLADVATPERRKMLSLELKRAEKECGGIHSTFIDGVADLCLDPNDPAESFGLVEELQRLAIEHHCPVITVLHENPSGAETGKTRGHLGSQLERKAESNLRVFKDAKGICTIYSERCRRASIPKDEGPRFAFDLKAGMHLTYHGDVQAEKTEAKRQRHQSLVDTVFQNAPVHGFIQTELKSRLLKADSTIKDRTARRRIDDWKALGLVQVTPAGKYQKASATEDFC